VQVKFSLAEHPDLKTAQALSELFSRFGAADTEHIAVILKPPKKNPTKPPKHGSALIPFKRIGDAFAAVCASGRDEKGLKGVEVGWVGGQEPPIIGWLKQKGMLSSATSVNPTPEPLKFDTPPSVPKTTSGVFSSFPSSFVRRSIHMLAIQELTSVQPETSTATAAQPQAQTSSAVDFESITLMRMRQAEREKLEREILDQEANE
jgi:DnaJ homolog subfamily C member 17